MIRFDVRMVAMTTLFLSAKVEEQTRKIVDVINVFYIVLQRKYGAKQVQYLEVRTKTTHSVFLITYPFILQNHDSLKDSLIKTERYILKELGFNLHVDHPHKFILFYVHILNGTNELAQQAWNYLNDSLRTTLCIRYKPEVIASGAIYLAAKKLAIPLPENPPWYHLYDTTLEQLQIIESEISSLYGMSKIEYINVLDPQGDARFRFAHPHLSDLEGRTARAYQQQKLPQQQLQQQSVIYQPQQQHSVYNNMLLIPPQYHAAMVAQQAQAMMQQQQASGSSRAVPQPVTVQYTSANNSRKRSRSSKSPLRQYE